MTTATQGGEDGSDTESGCCIGACHIVRVGGVRQGLCACCGSGLGCSHACCLCGSHVLLRVGVAHGALRLLRVVDLLHSIVCALLGRLVIGALCIGELLLGGLQGRVGRAESILCSLRIACNCVIVLLDILCMLLCGACSSLGSILLGLCLGRLCSRSVRCSLVSIDR